MNALDILRSQHDEINSLFRELGSDVDVNLTNKIINRLSGHTHVEDTVFYPALNEREATKKFVEEAKQEHIEVNNVIGVWQKFLGKDSWLENASKLKGLVEHHIQEEEKKLFPAVEKAFSEEELEELGSRMQA